jgi:RNA polymerase sigma-70 factor (ECF subfamily)
LSLRRPPTVVTLGCPPRTYPDSALALSLAAEPAFRVPQFTDRVQAGYRGLTSASTPVADPASEEARLLRSLRDGDEEAFTRLLGEYGPAMLRVAMLYVGSRAVAEEVVQEAWLGVIAGLPRFEGRSTLKTWIFRILTNIAKTRAVREGRSVPFSSFESAEDEEGEPLVDPSRFHPSGSTWAGHWQGARSPVRPEEQLLAREARERIDAAIQALPANQRAVLTLRDVSGFTSDEACDLLGISEVNQRVLLHRARARVREALEGYLEEAS